MVQKSFTFGKPLLDFDRRAQHAGCDLSFAIDKSPLMVVTWAATDILLISSKNIFYSVDEKDKMLVHDQLYLSHYASSCDMSACCFSSIWHNMLVFVRMLINLLFLSKYVS